MAYISKKRCIHLPTEKFDSCGLGAGGKGGFICFGMGGPRCGGLAWDRCKETVTGPGVGGFEDAKIPGASLVRRETTELYSIKVYQ